MEKSIKKNKIIKIASTLVLAVMLLFSGLLASCSKTGNIFGEFGYNGKYLYSFADKTITPVQAKNLISMGNVNGLGASVTTIAMEKPSVPENKISALLAEYSSVVITTKYYVADTEDQQTKVDELQGTDFKALLTTNEIAPFNQLVVKNIIAYSELIDYMEYSNDQFVGSQKAEVAPFKDIFTYHTTKTGNLVIQSRDFAEIPASIAGGIACSFRQDSEVEYDAEYKISRWQTSLGLWSTTPNGTSKQGYILEVQFDWIKKI